MKTASTSINFEHIDEKEVILEKLKTEHAEIMDTLLKLEPIDNDLHWNKVVNNNGIYIGELNDQNNRTGRGHYYWNDYGSYLFGYWKNGLQNGFCRSYKDKFMTYEGDFLDGLKHGNGTSFYSDENKHIGNYANNTRHGKGIYYWDKDSYWEGTFENDQFHGEGVFYYQGNPLKMDYDHGAVKK